MNRLVLGLAALVAAASGCASPARYVERGSESGVVAVPTNTDAFPTYYYSEAMALIRKHVGTDFEIVDEREFKTGQQTFNDQKVNNEETWNTSNPFLPATRKTVQNTTTTKDVSEWRIAYRKKMRPAGTNASPGTGEVGRGGTTTGVTPAGGPAPVNTSVQPAGGIVPPVGPTAPVAPAGGLSRDSGAGVYGSAGAVFGTTN